MNSTPFEMVHLMLEADSEKPLDLFLVGLALFVLPTGADAVRAHHFGILLWNREAALGVGHVMIRVPQDLAG